MLAADTIHSIPLKNYLQELSQANLINARDSRNFSFRHQTNRHVYRVRAMFDPFLVVEFMFDPMSPFSKARLELEEFI